MTRPLPVSTPNTWEFLRDAMIAPTGFREYDARWKYPDEINLPGMTALGLGLGTQMQRRGIKPEIAVGNDYRDYSLAIKQALIIGLMQAGIRVRDIGPALSPMAYFRTVPPRRARRGDGHRQPQSQRLDRRENGLRAPPHPRPR